MTRGRRTLVDAWPLALLVAAATVWYALHAVQVHSFQNDEEFYLQLSRWFPHHLPWAAFDFHYWQRGPQRLNEYAMAVPQLVFQAPLSFQVTRWIESLFFASAAIPAFLLLRALGAGRWWALAGGALTVALPWGVNTMSLLNENLAYATAGWAIYAVWLSCVRPGLGTDVLALLGIALAVLSRTGLIVLVVVWPVAVLVHGLRFPARAAPGAGARRRVVQLAKEHPLLSLLAAAGAAAIVLDLAGTLALKSVAGTYTTSTTLTASFFTERVPHQLSRVVTGTGVLPALVAVPWIAGRLVRPRDPGGHAFALVAVLTTALVLYSVSVSGLDERYYMYVAWLVSAGSVAALARREVSIAGIAVVAGLAALAIGRADWAGIHDEYQFLNFPAEAFWGRVILGHASVWSPGSLAAHPGTVAALAALAVGLAAAAVLWRWRASAWPHVAILALALGTGAAETRYVTERFLSVAGAKSGPTSDQRSWVDRIVPRGQHVAVFVDTLGNQAMYVPTWREIQFWNHTVDRHLGFEYNQAPLPLGAYYLQLQLDRRTGRLPLNVAGLPPDVPKTQPQWMLTPQLWERAGFVGRTVAAAGYLPVALVKLDLPLRARYMWEGADIDGWILRRAPNVRLRVWRAGYAFGRPVCLRFGLTAVPGAPHNPTFSLRGPGVSIQGAVRSGQRRDLIVPLPALTDPRRAEPYVDLRLLTRHDHKLDKRSVTLQPTATSVGSCKPQASG